VVLEVTSHALRLGRVRGLTFAGGLLAAIMPGEHTDFHRSYDEYVGAKRLFLSYLSPHAVLAYDADNRAARQLAAEASVTTLSGFSLEGRDTDLQFSDVVVDASGATFRIGGRSAAGSAGFPLHSPLLGRGHLRNVALALAYAFATGVTVAAARDVLTHLRPLRRRMERYEVQGRTVLDDTAAHPDSFNAVFEVAAMLPHENMVVVYAIRGSRGIDINAQNARVLCDLVTLHGAMEFVVTPALDCASGKDRATAAEIDATREALAACGVRFVWHDALRSAIQEAASRTRRGDLLLLIGAQAMDQGRGMLE
jgi:UDP-N-acetylmuramoyl-L-alanyl-D-glutamate--2,6-diaminopimelate ligase